jgi:diguanylate cyclase (GGDEF)-like protein/PAS domain S-box-containing protein
VAEGTLDHSSGHAVQVSVTATALHDADGDPHGVLVSFQDLTVPRRAAARRDRQESFFLALAQRASDLVAVTDPEGQVVYASEALAELVGWSPEDLTDLGTSGHVHPDDLELASAAIAQVLDKGDSEAVTLRTRDSAGQWHWLEATGSNLLRTAVGGVVWNFRDVDDRVRAEEALRASESRYRTIADNADEGLWVFEPDGTTVYANNRLAEILGLEAAEVTTRPILDLLDRGGRLRHGVLTSSTRSSERYEVDYRHPDGRLRTLRVSAAPLEGDGRFLAMVSDLTDARRLEKELRRSALHDSLTGLPNRALLFDRLEHALMRGERSTAALVVGIDRFKMVNDVWGHTVGDELLVRVATRLRAGRRPTDTVARFAGDEFVMICEGLDTGSLHDLALELLAALDEPFTVSVGEVRLTASIGIATSPAASAQELLRHADSAMYAAKAAGRHRVRVFDSGVAASTEERQRLGGDLRRALDDDALVLHHQPVIDLGTGRVVGTEALARWTHPVLGPVSPARFVPVAEEVGLAPDLDRWALRRALSDVRAMRARGSLSSDSYVAVNVSAYSLSDPELDCLIAETVLAAGFAPQEVLLEVTESAIMTDAPTAVGVLTRLRERGFQIAVDDFGTGHSSLSYLRALPVTMLKMDRSFVTELLSDPSALAIATSIIDLARAVGLTVVAEGVETRQHAEVLHRLGCDAAQGWLWSRAISPDEAVTTGALAAGYSATRPAETERG